MRFSNCSLSTWASGFFAGLVWISSVGHWHQYWQLQVGDFNETILIEGQIESLLSTQGRVNNSDSTDQRFNVRIESINGEYKYLAPYIFRLSWHKPEWVLKQGQKVRLMVKVKPAHGFANEGGFHYQQWLFSQKIQATGYIKPSELNQILTPTFSVRQHLLETILSFDLSEARWLVALSLGYRGLLDTSDWHMLQVTGTSHLVAISGLHMAVVATLSYVIFVNLLNYLMQLRLLNFSFPIHQAALIIALNIGLFYAYLAGFSIPTARAWTMMFVVSVLMLMNQSWSKVQSLLLLMVIVIILFPLSLYGISLWLSFLAVTVILLSLWRFPITSQKTYIGQKWWGAVRMQLLLSLFMLPLVIWQFSIFSISAPFINLIAVPAVTILLVPICVVSCFIAIVEPSIAKYGFIVANKLIHYCIDALSHIGELSVLYSQITAPSIYVLICLFLCLILFFSPRLPFPKYLTLIWLLPIASSFSKTSSDEWRVDVLDVGQGLSVLITRHHQAILYDTGPSYPSGFNTAEAVILPLLQSRGIEHLDLLIISHNDNDHAGGVDMLLSGIKVNQVISSEDHCINGWNRLWLGLKLEALWPMESMSADENEASCVVKISDDDHSVLLTGDIDKRVERKLINHHKDRLHSTLMVAPHHGSNSSSSSAFIRSVSPRYTVFSQGFLNRWKFPRSEVIERYNDHNVEMFTSSANGQVSFIFRNSDTEVKRYRQDTYPYWYANHTD
jgi:competence protein ComEC